MPKALRGKILFKINTRQKEKYALTDEVVLDVQKGYNFNLREDKASMGICMDGDSLKEGCEILIHHNATHESNLVPSEHFLSQKEISEGWGVYTVDEDMCFCYHDGKEWQPYKGFLITTRLFQPYKGKLTGIPHTQIPKKLLVLKGTDKWDDKTTDLSGKVMAVTEHSDYEIIYVDEKHKEHHLIRTRNRELLAIDEDLTKKVKSGEILVGLNENDCKPINK